MVPVSGHQMVKVLQKVGFTMKRQKGSHAIMSDGSRIVVVPCHGNETLPKGTQRGIIKDAGLTVEKFNSLI
jgi:predicted RNA binding protein YcfA (HicA-like mRNA interferase family)